MDRVGMPWFPGIPCSIGVEGWNWGLLGRYLLCLVGWLLMSGLLRDSVLCCLRVEASMLATSFFLCHCMNTITTGFFLNI